LGAAKTALLVATMVEQLFLAPDSQPKNISWQQKTKRKKYFIATKNKGNKNIQNIRIYYYCIACLHMA
jgi:hypothetical protein